MKLTNWFIPKYDLDFSENCFETTESSEDFIGSTENELTCIEKSDSEIFCETETTDFDEKLIMLASIMAEQCIMESKKIVTAQGSKL